jgi:hypothetical protein
MQTAILELPPELPTFASALSDLGGVPSILYRGLEHAAFKTGSFRDEQCPSEPLDGGLSASLFRFHGIRFLRREGIEAQQDEFRWTFDRLPFLGISFHYDQMHVRILKGPKGCLPGCGTSSKKSRFYNQVQSMYLINNKPVRSRANLLALWDFDATYGLAKLWLALPARAGIRPVDVCAFWCEPIPHPTDASASGSVPPPPPPSDDLSGLIQLEEPKEKKRIEPIR